MIFELVNGQTSRRNCVMSASELRRIDSYMDAFTYTHLLQEFLFRLVYMVFTKII